MFCPPQELDAMLDEYYRLRGWDAQGVPTAGRLATLGL
jgi:aldehyde:ferredoxin oxidoreductase